MKTTLITVPLALALLVAPAFAGNDKNYTYLALGDSIPFGFNPLLLPPYSAQLPTAAMFIGYPETVAAVEHLSQSQEINASCPGETSGSFLNTASTDYGCNSPHLLPPAPPFKISGLLHTIYSGAQMDFAESQLKTNKHINLVTLSIGANDILLALPALQLCGTDSDCTKRVLSPVLQSYGTNLAQILTRIRAQYQGTLILVKYYSPTPALDKVTIALNDVMTQVANQPATPSQPSFGAVEFADGFTAFKLASINHKDACEAGLLIRLPLPSPQPCDIHPSPLGRDLLAATVELAKWTRHQSH